LLFEVAFDLLSGEGSLPEKRHHRTEAMGSPPVDAWSRSEDEKYKVSIVFDFSKRMAGGASEHRIPRGER
jgi:hypothetical protein